MKKSTLKGIGLVSLIFAAKGIQEVIEAKRQPALPAGLAPKRRFLGMMGRAAAKTVLTVAGIERR
ncbi:MAG TPA: hypothetical protein VGN12_19450 [Pirellulales bacterium]|jgi:hypothetical protein